jgi:hypothetical protein
MLVLVNSRRADNTDDRQRHSCACVVQVSAAAAARAQALYWYQSTSDRLKALMTPQPATHLQMCRKHAVFGLRSITKGQD